MGMKRGEKRAKRENEWRKISKAHENSKEGYNKGL